MNYNKIIIPKKGEDGYRGISIRLKERTLEILEDISKQSNRSRNEVINILLESAVKATEIDDVSQYYSVKK